VPNKVTAEAKAACNELVDDVAYRAALRKRLIGGKLAPALECMLWWYAKGKPTDRLDVDVGPTLVDLVLASYRRPDAPA